MRKIAVLAMLALPVTAAAQPGATPYYAQPPEPAPALFEPKAHLEIGLIAGTPKGDWEQLDSETSPGFHLQLGYTIGQNISLFGGLRYMRVEYNEQTLGTTDLELSHRELQLGLRYMSPISPSAKFFLEGNIHSATLTASTQGESEQESGMGLGVRAGLVFMVDTKIGLGVAVGYSSADITAGEDEFEDAWLTGDASLSFFF